MLTKLLGEGRSLLHSTLNLIRFSNSPGLSVTHDLHYIAAKANPLLLHLYMYFSLAIKPESLFITKLLIVQTVSCMP